MQRMLAQRQAVATSASISAAVEGYHAFLRQMRLQPSGLEPSALVDLVWHTHQQHPVRYVLPSLPISSSAKILGRLPSLSNSRAQCEWRHDFVWRGRVATRAEALPNPCFLAVGGGRYAADCLAIVGHEVDQDDDLSSLR